MVQPFHPPENTAQNPATTSDGLGVKNCGTWPDENTWDSTSHERCAGAVGKDGRKTGENYI